jgi:hypothetical protein
MKNSNVRNPYLDSLEARGNLDIALTELRRTFDSVEQVGRKQLYLVEDSHLGSKFYIYIVSAPSNIRLDKDIMMTMRKNGSYPFYVLFSRDPKTYPDGSFKSYWGKVKKIYKLKGKFKGCIMGIDELNNSEIIDSLFECSTIPLDIERVKNAGVNVDIDLILRELGIGITKLDSAKRMLELIKNN